MEPHEKYDAIIRSAMILAQARRNNWHEAAKLVNELADTYDGPGIQVLICGLADTIIIHQGGHTTADDIVVAPMWVGPDGATSDADGVSRPEILWAGRFLAARAALDEDTCAALVNSSDADYSRNVFGLLEVAATTLNEMGAPETGSPQ